jgi:hypothetical protein
MNKIYILTKQERADMFNSEGDVKIIGYTTDIEKAVDWLHKSIMDTKYDFKGVNECL